MRPRPRKEPRAGWGWNDFGQLGTGSLTSSSAPVAVSGGNSFNALVAGGVHTCGLTSTGMASCWGRNQDGELGNGSTSQSSIPVSVVSSLGFTAVALGGAHTCGFTISAGTYCWGHNGAGQLGDGTTSNSTVPVAVSWQQASAVAMGNPEGARSAAASGTRRHWSGRAGFTR